MLSVSNMLSNDYSQMDTTKEIPTMTPAPMRPTALTISHLLCEPAMKTPSLSPSSSPSPIDSLPCSFNEKASMSSLPSLPRTNFALQSRPFLPTLHLVSDKKHPLSSHPYPYDNINDNTLSSTSLHYNNNENEEKEVDELDDDDDHLSHHSKTSSVSASDSSEALKAKRKRANTKQLETLNRVFDRTFFPSTQMRIELGKQLAMSPRTVQIWFQNKRQAMRTKERQRLLKLKNGIA